jgi:hypothetical protein
MILVKTNWYTVSKAEISMGAIKMLHIPHEHYRFTPDGYQPVTQFKEFVGLPHFLYVINGECTIAAIENEITLQSGEFTYLTRGDYFYHIIGELPLKVVRVTKLPEQLIKK